MVFCGQLNLLRSLRSVAVTGPNPRLPRAAPPRWPGFWTLPSRGSGRTDSGSLSLRDDPFEAKLAGVREHRGPIALDVLIEPQSGARLGQERRQRGLADDERLTPQILAVEIEQIEGIKKGHSVMLATAEHLEAGEAVRPDHDNFAVDQTGARPQPPHRRHHGRVPIGPIMAVAGEQPNVLGLTASHQPKAVVLDFMHPPVAARRPGRGRRLAGCKEGAGKHGSHIRTAPRGANHAPV